MLRDFVRGRPSQLLNELRPFADYLKVAVPPDEETIDRVERIIENCGADVNSPVGELIIPPAVESEVIALVRDLVARPAIFVEDGDFVTPLPQWKTLERSRETLRNVISAVGRIEFAIRDTQFAAGTGFLVAPDTLLTNRHVVEDYLSKSSAGVRVLKNAIRPRVDFNEERKSARSNQFAIEEILTYPSGRLDYCLLRIARFGEDGSLQPKPLPITADRPRKGQKVCAVGYPAEPSLKAMTATLARAYEVLFASTYGVKRLSPGFITSTTYPVALHDCSTLGGSSGSCLVTLGGSVIGLHYDGTQGTGNFAVSSAALLRERALETALSV